MFYGVWPQMGSIPVYGIGNVLSYAIFRLQQDQLEGQLAPNPLLYTVQAGSLRRLSGGRNLY